MAAGGNSANLTFNFEKMNRPDSEFLPITNPWTSRIFLSTGFEKKKALYLASAFHEQNGYFYASSVKSVHECIVCGCTCKFRDQEKVCGCDSCSKVECHIYSDQPDLERHKYIHELDKMAKRFSSNMVDLRIAFRSMSEREIEEHIKHSLKNSELSQQILLEKLNIRADENLCSVCMLEKKNILLSPCNHLCVCEKCSTHINSLCPICRTPVKNILKVFL